MEGGERVKYKIITDPRYFNWDKKNTLISSLHYTEGMHTINDHKNLQHSFSSPIQK